MKTIPALTIGALCLFGFTTQMAFGQSNQGDQNKHQKKDHSGQSEHSNRGRGNSPGGGGFSAPRQHSSSSNRHRSNNGGAVNFQAPKHSARTFTPKQSFTRGIAPAVQSHSNRSHSRDQSRSFNREIAPAVQSRSNRSHSRDQSRSFNREIAPNVQSRSRDHSPQNRVQINRGRNVQINTRRSSSHTNRFSVSRDRYNTFISSGWRSHHGWDRDRSGNFFYRQHRIFFSLISGFYYPYYLEAGVPVYVSYAANGGDTVASVQQALQQAGYYQGAVDGEFGPMTSQAIANYQNDQGLAPTGQINDALIDSLGLD